MDNATTTAIHTHYNVRVVGKIWLPQCDAAMDFTVDPSQLPEYPRADDETEPAYETRMVECAVDMMAGDFSGIDAYEIVKHEYWFDTPMPNRERAVGESTTYTRHDRYTTLREFDEGAEMRYSDCMLGEYEEESEDEGE